MEDLLTDFCGLGGFEIVTTRLLSETLDLDSSVRRLQHDVSEVIKTSGIAGDPELPPPALFPSWRRHIISA